MHAPEQARPLTREARFFAQFAQSRLDRILARLHHTARNLQGKSIDPEAELPHQHESTVGRKGEDITPIRRGHDDKVLLGSAHRMAVTHTE